MDVLVPYAATEPKTRLAPVLEPAERETFARAMLLDVCDAVDGAGFEPRVLATAAVECPYPVVVDDRPLTAAVADRLAPPTAVVMADLPLVTSAAIRRLLDDHPDADVVLAPGLGGGTNAICTRHPDFTVDYHGASIRDHREIAREAGASLATVDSFRLAVDVDEPGDLVELLLHGEGRARRWLVDAGFAISPTDGRVVATREGSSSE